MPARTMSRLGFSRGRAVLVIGIIVGIAVLAWLASVVGGVSIRRAGLDQAELEVVDPLLPGVPFDIRWTPTGVEDFSLLLVARGVGNEISLPEAQYRQAILTAALPCSLGDQDITLQLQRVDSGEIVALSSVTVLPAGPDCF